MHKETYSYDLTTYLKDSNAYGNTYFARYFEWQGICREAWFFDCISPDFLRDKGVFITKSAHCDYIKEVFPFQKIRCFVNSRDIKKASFYLDFTFCSQEDSSIIFARGWQQILFANHSHRPSAIPGEVLAKVKIYSGQT
jgi:acyl-CoA thioesterase FadM